MPLRFEEFKPCMDWWKRRKENGQTWKIKAENVLKYNGDSRLVSVNLDLKNPNSKNDVEHRPPEELVAGILEKEHRIIEIVERIKALLEKPL
jgi:type I restriction enzyme M protein